MGAVLHTLNLRLFPEQLAYIVTTARTASCIVDGTVLPVLAKVADQLTTVEAYVVVGDGDTSALGDARCTATRTCWPPRRTPTTGPSWTSARRAPCATRAARPATPRASSTATGRRTCTRWRASRQRLRDLTERDTVLPVVPMFHANAWGLAYSGWLAGADFVLPGRFLQAEPLARMIAELRPTVAGAVPTIWNDLLSYVDAHPTDLTSLRLVACGGAAVPLGADAALRAGPRRAHRPGVGDDRDLAARRHRARARSARPRSRSGLARARPAASWPASSCASSTTTARSCPGTARRSARSRCAARGSPARTTSTTTRRSSPTAGCAPATSPPPCRTASSRSPTAARTSSSPAASGSARSSSRGRSWRTRRCSRPPSSPCPTSGGTSGRWPASSCARTRPSRRPSSPPSCPTRSRAGGCPSAGRSSRRSPRPASASSTRRCCGGSTPTASSTVEQLAAVST